MSPRLRIHSRNRWPFWLRLAAARSENPVRDRAISSTSGSWAWTVSSSNSALVSGIVIRFSLAGMRSPAIPSAWSSTWRRPTATRSAKLRSDNLMIFRIVGVSASTRVFNSCSEMPTAVRTYRERRSVLVSRIASMTTSDCASGVSNRKSTTSPTRLIQSRRRDLPQTVAFLRASSALVSKSMLCLKCTRVSVAICLEESEVRADGGAAPIVDRTTVKSNASSSSRESNRPSFIHVANLTTYSGVRMNSVTRS